MGVKATTRKVGRSARNAGKTLARVPGPSTNSATNLLILDVAIRGASLIAGRAVERAALRARYNAEKAANIVEGRSATRSLMTAGAARLATRSVPGLLLVTGGLLAKVVFDRSLGRRKSAREGEQQLAEQAERAEDA
jgi:hypothetical protein